MAQQQKDTPYMNAFSSKPFAAGFERERTPDQERVSSPTPLPETRKSGADAPSGATAAGQPVPAGTKTIKKSHRGFAAMDAERQRQIASQGGKAAHQRGTAHKFDSDEARNAGRKGGVAVSQDRKHMAEIGAQGGRARGINSQKRKAAQKAERDAKKSESNLGASEVQRGLRDPDQTH